ncbi:alpha-tocopherol transfer protein-like [Anthonomus grandis grandis]|uniref:alpha-tocopherol transfer protein-like n=1 Tax=Anthonomus grandis grandis TaxID=2921223 RepID=UPI00216688A4|nr:alpha-tocopherol transfer protein-like [Anthonomus grandis grandis]
MDMDSLLHTDKTRVRRLVLEKLDKSEEILCKDVQLLKNWFKYQKHLPQIPCDNILELFLIVNKFNLEKCKKRLENYFTIRKEIPDLYVEKHPNLEHMRSIAQTVYIIPLPKLTPSLSRVTIMKLKDLDPEKFVALNFFAHSYNIVEIRIREDVVLTDTIVYDMEGIQLSHLLKLRIGAIKKSTTVLEKVFSSRVEGIHYINLPASMQVFVNLVKTMLKEKIRKRIYVHKNLESLHEHLTQSILPKDYGGTEASLDELHDLWIRKLDANREVFDYLDTLAPKGQESCSKNDFLAEEELFESNFRSLCID